MNPKDPKIPETSQKEPDIDQISAKIESSDITSPAGVSENLAESTADPFDALTDADLGIKKNQ